jgi:hypothetical protein
MKMKYLIIALISIAVSSCGGLESKVKKLAEKRCECVEIKEDEKRIECHKEADDMKKDLVKEINDAKLKTAEDRELKQLLKDTYRDCKRK